MTKTIRFSVFAGLVMLTWLTASSAEAAVQVPARCAGQYFEVQGADGAYQPVYIKAVNLSAVLPGSKPTEFPRDLALYRQWLRQIAEMNCNAVRVLTRYPPEFYLALEQHNQENAAQVLLLLQGVWFEPPSDFDYLEHAYTAGIRRDILRTVNAVHGTGAAEGQPADSMAAYSADVSRWVLAFIIGRELDPKRVLEFQAASADYSEYQGEFISARSAQPIECWLASLCDALVRFEDSKYGMQHPVTFSNWVATDVVSHAEEPADAHPVDQQELRRVPELDNELNDSVNISSSSFTSEPRYLAGLFASYHVYPYYPSFLQTDPDYARADDWQGPNSFLGYLQELKTHYSTMPLLISEFGLANGPFPVHRHNLGWHYGGLTERQVAQLLPRLAEAVQASGCAGAAVFSWIDEWFKSAWLWAGKYDPAEDMRYWYNQLDPEQNFGMLAVHPGKFGPRCTLSGDDAEWQGAATFASGNRTDAALLTMRAMHDEGYLYLRIELPAYNDWDFTDHQLQLGLDIIYEDLGNHSWLHPLEMRSELGLEVVLAVADGEARLYQAEDFQLWPGLSYAQAGSWFAPVFESNESIYGMPDGSARAAVWPVNPLPSGSLREDNEGCLALWNATADARVLEFRLPWILLGMVGPHRHRVQGRYAAIAGRTARTPGINILAVLHDQDGRVAGAWPGVESDVVTSSPASRYIWSDWRERDIEYHFRLKPAYHAMRDTYARQTTKFESRPSGAGNQ